MKIIVNRFYHVVRYQVDIGLMLCVFWPISNTECYLDLWKVVNVLPFLSVFLLPNETFSGVPVFVSQSLSHLPFCTFLSLFFPQRLEFFGGKSTNANVWLENAYTLTNVRIEVINDVISRFFNAVCASSQFFYVMQNKIHGGLKVWILFSIVFTPRKNVYIFAPPCSVLCIW